MGKQLQKIYENKTFLFPWGMNHLTFTQFIDGSKAALCPETFRSGRRQSKRYVSGSYRHHPSNPDGTQCPQKNNLYSKYAGRKTNPTGTRDRISDFQTGIEIPE